MNAPGTPFEPAKMIHMSTKATRHDVKWSLATVLKAYRGRLGISQEELAGRARLHRAYLSDIERGMRNLSLERVDKLAARYRLITLVPGRRSGDRNHRRA